MNYRALSLMVSKTSFSFQPQIRSYARWSHRRPSKVYLQGNVLEEKIIDLDPKTLGKMDQSNSTVRNDTKIRSIAISKDIEKKVSETTSGNSTEKDYHNQKKKFTSKTKNFEVSNVQVFDENGEIIYEKLKNNDSRIGLLLTSVKSKKRREKSGQIMVEGWRMIMDGLIAKCKLQYLIFSRVNDLEVLKPYLPKTGLKIYKIPYKEIEILSDVETPSGVIGIFKTPQPEHMNYLPGAMPIEVICDNIRIPGNLGSILRACAGVGVEKLYLMKGCVDLWDSKVVRSGAGAHFRIPVETSLEWNEIPSKVNPASKVFIADSNSKIVMRDKMSESSIEDLNLPLVPYYSVEYGTMPGITLIIGGETEGVSEESYRFAAERQGVRLNIPLEFGVDSLNSSMAMAIIAFEMKKKLIQVKRAEKFALHDVS